MNLDAQTLARRTDPVTSHMAAARVSEFAGSHQETILAVLRNHPNGLTAHEVAQVCGLEPHQVGKRTRTMERKGQIEHVLDANSSPVTRSTPSGRPACVLRIKGWSQ